MPQRITSQLCSDAQKSSGGIQLVAQRSQAIRFSHDWYPLNKVTRLTIGLDRHRWAEPTSVYNGTQIQLSNLNE